MLWAISIFAAIVLGFAVRRTVGDLVAGLFIRSEKRLLPGTFISVGGACGELVGVGLTTTILRNQDGNLVVPNSRLTTQRIKVFPRGCALPVAILVTTSRDSDPATVERALLAAANAQAELATHPAPEVLFTFISPSALTFEFRAWIKPTTDREPIDDDFMQSVRIELILAAIRVVEVTLITNPEAPPWMASD